MALDQGLGVGVLLHEGRQHHEFLPLRALNCILVDLELDVEDAAVTLDLRRSYRNRRRRRRRRRFLYNRRWWRRRRRCFLNDRWRRFLAESIQHADRKQINVALIADGIVDSIALRFCAHVEGSSDRILKTNAVLIVGRMFATLWVRYND